MARKSTGGKAPQTAPYAAHAGDSTSTSGSHSDSDTASASNISRLKAVPCDGMDKVLAVLPLVMQHHSLLTFEHNRLLCRLLRVSTSVRAVLQQSGVPCSVTLFSEDLARSRVASSFPAWLPQNGGLLHTLYVYTEKSSPPIWEQRISTALQEYSRLSASCSGAAGDATRLGARATRSATAAAAAAAAVGAAAGVGTAACAADPARPPLGLASVTWYSLQTPALLHELRLAPGLRQLKLLQLQKAAVTPAMLAALGQLTTLRSLELSLDGISALPRRFGSAVGKLSALMQLRLRYVDDAEARRLAWLPTSLCDLSLDVLSAQGGDVGRQPVPLAFLLELECLDLSWAGEQAGTVHVDMPATLTKLSVEGKVQANAMPTGIRLIKITDPALCPGMVEALPALGRLQAIKLRFTRRSPPDVGSLLPVVSVLKGLTGLTSVSIGNGYEQLPVSTFKGVELCRVLAQLSSLQELKCSDVAFDTSDALHLSALTQLTRLKVMGGCSGFNDVVVSSLALCLTNLEVLDIGFCGLQTQAVFPVLARLPKLSRFEVVGNEVVVDNVGLMRFTSSQSLTFLQFDVDTHVISDEALAQFGQVMPHVKVDFS